MIVLVLFLLVNGVPVEQGIRSENGKDYDTFKSVAECEKQAKKDMAEIFVPQFGEQAKLIVLKCERR